MHIVRDTQEVTANIVTKTEKELRNANCRIRFDARETAIRGTDLTDLDNEPSFFTQTKRSVPQVWQQLSDEFNEQTTFRTAINVISNKVRVHTYCARD